MMVVLWILLLHHTPASRTLGWWPYWPHCTLGMCTWGMHLSSSGEVFALLLTPIHEPRVFGFILVGTSRFDYSNTCSIVVPPWANKEPPP